MKNNLLPAFLNLAIVFKHVKYVLLAVLISFLYYVVIAISGTISLMINTYPNLEFSEFVGFVFTLIATYGSTVTGGSLVTLVLISVLIGVLFSMVVYKMKVVSSTPDNKMGFFSSVGVFLGVLAPGCAACGMGLLPLLGLSAASLTFFPYGGLELSVLAVIILSYSVLRFSRKLMTCEIVNKK